MPYALDLGAVRPALDRSGPLLEQSGVPRVTFTPNLRRHVDCPPAEVAGSTVREALEAAFRDNPRARGYVLDDQGAVRKHVMVFVDGDVVRDRVGLSDPVAASAEIYIMQALSGG